MRPSAVLSALALSSSLVAAQNGQNTINFSTIEVFSDLKRCLKGVFSVDYGINGGRPVQKEIGCETNDCICRADTLQDAISTAGLLAQSACSNSIDRLTATSILQQYCIDKGITAGVPTPTDAIGSARFLPPSVSSTPTPTPVVETKNIISTVSGSPVTILSTVTTIPEQTSSPQETKNGSSGGSNIGTIAGGVVGGLAVLGAIAGFLIWFLRRKRNNSYSSGEQGAPPSYEKDYQANQMGGMEMDSRQVGGIQSYSDRP
ncbi:hypothetical protein TWF730_009245 [Orbilia blumenaviensis]|uniref:Uncharacterized protein n=1 Tax=Orbilia blumenaviensis TaxID=1796055 RepID=A0AAV9UZ78_9PEZI